MYVACRSLEISVIGGHTEITYGLDHPIIAGTMIGEVSREKLITPKGASPGDHILLTKGVPNEGTAILAREFSQQLDGILTNDKIQTARDFLYEPGISVLRDARLAIQAGKVTAMHDPPKVDLLVLFGNWLKPVDIHSSLTHKQSSSPLWPRRSVKALGQSTRNNRFWCAPAHHTFGSCACNLSPFAKRRSQLHQNRLC